MQRTYLFLIWDRNSMKQSFAVQASSIDAANRLASAFFTEFATDHGGWPSTTLSLQGPTPLTLIQE